MTCYSECEERHSEAGGLVFKQMNQYSIREVARQAQVPRSVLAQCLADLLAFPLLIDEADLHQHVHDYKSVGHRNIPS